MNAKTCVAISTTGDPHRLGFLARTVKGWAESGVDHLFVTVDGDQDACDRVFDLVGLRADIYRVGQVVGIPDRMRYREGRLGVAVNKNTGLELMMHNTDADHLFLSDDDIYPLSPMALDLHVSGNLKHSMVCWGQHRFIEIMQDYQCASWNWPRGSMMYVTRRTVEQVGGMVEAFGPGGHEHVEWSRRIHQHGITPCEYPSPYIYATQRAMAAGGYWKAIDMPLPGEGIAGYQIRKDQITSVRRLPGDWEKIEQLMAEQDGSRIFVPYTGRGNGRASATLYSNTYRA